MYILLNVYIKMSNEDYGYILDMVIRKDLVKKLGDIYKNELIDKNELDKITPICAPLSYNDDNIDFDELFNILDDIDSDTDSDKDSENGDSICALNFNNKFGRLC